MTAAVSGHCAYTQLTDAEAGIYLSEARMQRERELGYWPDRVLTDYFDETVTRRPGSTAIAACRTESGDEVLFSHAQLDSLVSRIAGKFSALDIGKGDVVSFQLPNWWQFIAVHLACIRIGAVSNPLSPIFRAWELEYMLGHAGSRLLIVPKTFRGFDHEALARQLSRKIPALKNILVVDGEGDDAFESIFDQSEAPGTGLPTQLQPDDILKLMFTSGTTGEPKAVMHTSNTLLTAVVEARKRLQLDESDVVFMPSPLAHSIGFLYGMMMAVVLGVKLVSMDQWDVGLAIDLIERHQVTYMFAATPFLVDLVSARELKPGYIGSLRLFVTSGAPVPPALISQASSRLNARIVAGWGMTETGFVTSTSPAMEPAGLGTDGLPLPCSEVRVVDDAGKEVACGTAGHLQYRGSTLFVGYYKRPDLYDVDAAGWFNTGDLATLNEAGYINIVGRDKDVIIRGGLNVPVIEVEKLLFSMPQILEVAVVGMPDPRLGEKGCAFVSLQPGCRLTLQELQAFMQNRQMAKQYMPEHLEIIAELPKTPSGKVQKFKLREMARQLAGTA